MADNHRTRSVQESLAHMNAFEMKRTAASPSAIPRSGGTAASPSTQGREAAAPPLHSAPEMGGTAASPSAIQRSGGTAAPPSPAILLAVTQLTCRISNASISLSFFFSPFAQTRDAQCSRARGCMKR